MAMQDNVPDNETFLDIFEREIERQKRIEKRKNHEYEEETDHE